MNDQAVKEAEKQHAVAMSQLQRILGTDEAIEIVWTDPELTFEDDIETYTKKRTRKQAGPCRHEKNTHVSQGWKTLNPNLPSSLPWLFLPTISVMIKNMFGDNGEGYTFGAQASLNLFNGFFRL